MSFFSQLLSPLSSSTFNSNNCLPRLVLIIVNLITDPKTGGEATSRVIDNIDEEVLGTSRKFIVQKQEKTYLS